MLTSYVKASRGKVMRKRFGGIIVRRVIVAAVTVMLATGTITMNSVKQNISVVCAEEAPIELNIEQENEESKENISLEVIEETAKDAVETAEEAVQQVESVVEDIKTEKDSAKGLSVEIITYNENVEIAQEEINEQEKGLSETLAAGKIVVSGEEGEETTTVELNTYMEEKVTQAATAAETAKESLENLIEAKVNGNENRETIQAYVDAVTTAASDAAKAVESAQSLYDEAEKQLLNEMKKYNAYAQAYGLELITYKNTTPIFSQEELEVEIGNGKITLTEQTGQELSEAVGAVAETIKGQQDVIVNAGEALQQAQDNCNKAKEEAQSAYEYALDALETAVDDKGAEKAQQNVKTAETTVEYVQNTAGVKVEEAKADYETAKAEYEQEKQELEMIQQELQSATILQIDANALLARLEQAKVNVNVAKKKMNNAKESLVMAESFKGWAETLAPDAQNETRIYAQIDETKEDGLATGNIKQFDQNDEEVITRNQKNFVEITDDMEVIVPEEIYVFYVQKVYDLYNHDKLMAGKQGVGDGISVGTKMPIVYWALNEEGKIDAESAYYFEGDESMPEGRYFVGYTFKHDANVYYHIDGYMVDYVKNTTSESEQTPESESTPESEQTPESESTPESEQTPESESTPESEQTPESESTPESEQTPESGQTPESTKTNTVVTIVGDDTPLENAIETVIIEEPTPLVALNDEEVPLADSVPKTGDATAMASNVGTMGLMVLGAAFVMRARRKKI